MPRYIDADALEDSLGVEDEDILFKEKLRNAPTVDAVPVVRCGECAHAHLKCQECDVLPQELTITPNSYCPFGKRKDDGK